MKQKYFTKIIFAGEEVIMITDNYGEPILFLSNLDIKKLNEEWKHRQ